MILIVHSVVAAATANQIANPWIAWLSALISHFILDLIPYRGYSIENAKYGWKSRRFWTLAIKITIDLITGFIFIIIFTRDRSNLFKNIIAGFIGLIPDGLTILYFITKNHNLTKFISGQEILENNNEKTEKTSLRKISDWLGNFYYKFHNALHIYKKPPLLWGIVNQFIIFLTALLTL